MKKIAKATIACMATCMALVFYSCDEKTTDDLNADYADFTIQQSKENLQSEGMAVLEKIDAMKDMEWVSSVQSLMGLMGMGMQDEEINNAISPLLAPLANADKNIMGIATLRASSNAMDSLSNVFKKFGGTYTYNAGVDTFDYSRSTTHFTISFPIGESTTNNGTLTIDNYTYQYSKTIESTVLEMPRSLRMTLKKGNTTLLSLIMSASYRDDDMPSMENTVITFKEGYIFDQTANYDPKKVSWDFSFALNSQKFFQGGCDMDGTLSYDSISAHLNENTLEENTMDRLFNNMNASVQLGNIKAVGKVTYAQFLKDKQAFDETYGGYRDNGGYNAEPTQEAIIDKKCAIYNNNVKATLLYADSKKAIAKLLFYKKNQEDGYNSWFKMDSKAAFEDGTSLDGSFFDEGFSQFDTALDNFIAEMKANYHITNDQTTQPN